VKKIIATIFITFGLTASSGAGETIKGNFEGGNRAQYFEYDPSNIYAGVSYFSSSARGIRRYRLSLQADCGFLRIYRPYNSKNQIMIDGSCTGQGSQVHQYLYEWDKRYMDWCLRKEISGERADRTSGSDERLDIEKVKGCIPLGSERNN
jgi:hypothetical protein